MGADRPDWLPAGWTFIVKTRSCGRKDKYYVNPSGTKFNSKREVLRHLEVFKKVQKPTEKVEIEKALALPPGWIKKTVTTKKKGKIRKDPYYIDPYTGREFRSVPEVLRYLGTPDLIKNKSKPDVKSRIIPSTRAVTRMSTDKKPGSEKDRNVAHEKVNLRVYEPRVLRSGSKFAARETIVTAPKNTLKHKKRRINSAINERGEGGRRKSKRLSEIKAKDAITNNEKLQSAAEKTEVVESNEPEKIDKGDKKVLSPNGGKFSGSKLSRDPHRKNSKRNSGAGFDSSLEETRKSNIAHQESKTLDERGGAVLTVDEKEQSSKVIGGSKPESYKGLLLDPCIEFAIKTLTGEIPIEDITKVNSSESPVSSLNSPNQASSSSVLTSRNILADPCFEFAVKTLTGDEVPAEKGSKFQISFDRAT